MSSEGELGSVVGSAAALQPEDLVYTQYREQGAHVWRGFTLDQIFNQCIGTVYDAAKGRQMPVHYGSKELNNVTVSSPLSIPYVTQPRKFRNLQAQATLCEWQRRRRWPLATSAKALQVKATSQLPSTSQLL